MIDRLHFYKTYRNVFGKLNQEQVNGLNFLLGKLENGTFKLSTQMAYMLATIKHETNNTFHPVVEGYYLKSNRIGALYAYYRKHNPDALNTIFPYGTSQPTYEGRGYVQITHFDNYHKYGLLSTPEKALEPETAFMIMESGMANGLFTGKTLQRYVNENQTDYVQARKVINGLDRANLIAGYAGNFNECIEFTNTQYSEAEINDIINLA